MVADMDSILRLLSRNGKAGCYSVLIFVLLCFNNVITILNHLCMTIYGAKTPHRCRLPPGQAPNFSLPMVTKNGHQSFDQCSAYVNYSLHGNLTEPCHDGWEYSTVSDRERNIIMEFELVCSQEYLKNLSTTIYFCGVMIGGLIFGALSDRFGRKPSLLTSLYLQLGIGVAIAFANSYVVFTLLRFFQGILMQGLQTCSFVMISEMFPTEHRATAGTVFEVFWGMGVIWLALLSYLIQNWRYIQLAITVPSVLTIAYIWVIPESLRWLIINQKFKQAESVLKKLAKFNCVSLPEDPLGRKSNTLLIISTSPTEDNMATRGGDRDGDVEEAVPREKREELEVHMQEEGKEEGGQGQGQVGKKYSLLDMCRTPKLRERTLVFCYIWFVAACGYYGLSLSLTSLSGNKYFNLFLGGICELPAYISAIFIVKRFGRCRPLALYLLIGGITCIAAGLTPITTASGKDIQWVSRGLAVIGRFAMAGCFSILFLYTSEVFPTVIRNMSVGTCSFWTRMGGVLAPQVLTLGRVTFSELPVILFGSLSLIGAYVSLRLPETRDCKLPDTIEEAEEMKPAAKDAASRATNQIYKPQNQDNSAPLVEKVHISHCESISKDLSTTGISSMKETFSCDV